jgi:hypothetical protein
MAIDRTTGKRKKIVKSEIEFKEERKKKAKPKFDVTYEEELIKSLFEEDIKKQNKLNTVEDVQEEDRFHHERPGEE